MVFGKLYLSSFSNEDITKEKLLSFLSLPVGWHYGEGAPPSMHLIKTMQKINSLFYRLGLEKSDAFPGIDGEVMLTGYVGEISVELLVFADAATANVSLEIGNDVVWSVEAVSLVDAFKKIVNASSQWQSSEQSTQSTTMHIKRDSTAWRLKSLRATTEFPFSLPGAQSTIQEVYAAT